MKVEITGSSEAWIQYEIAAGSFKSPEDAIGFAINQAKLNYLREAIAESLALGGRNSPEEALAKIDAHLAKRAVSRKAS